MVIRLSDGLARPPGRGEALAAIEAEVLNEKVESLGRAGRHAEAALAALRAYSGEPGGAEHEALLDAAAAKVWALLVQRELCGLRDTRMIVEDMAIPGAVMARLGVVRRPGAAP